MTTPGPDGKYDISTRWYKDDSNGEIDTTKIKEHFLTPKLALYEGIPVKRTVIAIAMGALHLLVAARDPGQLQAKTYSSGLNNYGQTGHASCCRCRCRCSVHDCAIHNLTGNLTLLYVPRIQGDHNDVGLNFHKLKLIQGLANENIGQLAAGQHFSLALSLDGKRLYSFGRADSGQVGIGITATGDLCGTPGRVRFPASYANPDTGTLIFTQIAAGETHALAVDDSHQVYTWGECIIRTIACYSCC